MANTTRQPIRVNKDNADRILTPSLLNSYNRLLETNKCVIVPYVIYKLMEVSSVMAGLRREKRIVSAIKTKKQIKNFTS